MELDLKFCRFESAPWGFRLVGGADFEIPLTVAKVTEEGLAEQAGMRVGDIVIRINECSTEQLSHTDVQKAIKECGNNFFLTIYREVNDELEHNNADPVAENIDQITSEGHELQNGTAEVIETIKEENINEMTDEVEETLQENVSEIKKTVTCQRSEVLQTVKEESWKTMAERETEKRKWSTFLQRPNRPIPKCKTDVEPPTETYKVLIVKQPKRKETPDKVLTLPEEKPSEVVETIDVPEEVIDTETPKNEEEVFEPLADSEVPNLEQAEDVFSEVNITGIELEKIEDNTADEESSPVDNVAVAAETPENIEIPMTAEDLLYQKQLTDIQQQLLALSSLPSTIQATLDAVTRKLSDLLPNVKLESSLTSSAKFENLNIENHEENGNVMEECSNVVEENAVSDEANIVTDSSVQQETIETAQDIEIMEKDIVEEYSENHNEIHEEMSMETTFSHEKYEEEFHQKVQSTKSQKDQVLIELGDKQRLIKERLTKVSPRTFSPLTPQERPLVLPGGRKWRRPADAFNDEFIADILSSQAELIVGTTLGVNFFKYKKPEKHIDLEKSEVYKVIHSLDNAPKRGIEVRAEKVIAAADIHSC